MLLARVKTPLDADECSGPCLLLPADERRVTTLLAALLDGEGPALPDTLAWQVARCLRWDSRPVVVADRSSSLEVPWGVHVDAAGALYVADKRNARVMKWAHWAAGGEFAVVAGGNGKGEGLHQLDMPCAIDVLESDGSVFVADGCGHRVVRWRRGATEGEVVGRLNTPWSVAVCQRTGDVYAGDYDTQRAVRWPADGGPEVELARANGAITGLALLPAGDGPPAVALSAYGSGDVTVWVPGPSGGAPYALARKYAGLRAPYGLSACADTGEVYAAVRDDSCVLVLYPDGSRSTVCNGLRQPRGVFVRDGLVFICETDEDRVVAVPRPGPREIR